ncbi:uncharacterized protein [Triticum aestivum]|uniref:uncharacterized protein n=1 Tax=Triticum aestivum TaxID=4565 RepID=UPI001D003790|nr:uncharacterized protein LOC123135132 [Triticum aestivum]
MGTKGKSRLRNKRGGVALRPHAPPVAQAKAGGGDPTAKTGSEEKVAILTAHNAAELPKARAEVDNAQQRDDGEVVLPQVTDLHLHGATDGKAAQPADDGPGELEREAPGSGEVVLPDEVEAPGLHGATKEADDVPVAIEGEAPGSGEVVVPPDEVEEPVLHSATAEEVVRPATEEADDVPVKLEAGGSGEETHAPHAEKELPDDTFAGDVLVDHNVVHPEEVASLRRRLAAARARNLLNPDTIDELNKLFEEMGLSVAVASKGQGRR